MKASDAIEAILPAQPLEVASERATIGDMPSQQIQYSEKYYDDIYEYR